jgi:hypothetical protein
MSADATPTPVNPYSAPQARVADMDLATDGLFYVVAPRKFLILMIGTLAGYTIYWFYKNWSLLDRRDKKYWPVMRSIFAIFFTHSLFREVDAILKRDGKLGSFAWDHSGLATVFVVSALVGTVCSQLAAHHIGLPFTILTVIGLLIPRMYSLYRAQIAINLASDDPQGLTNDALTLANFAWLVFGVLIWLSTLGSWYLILTGRLVRGGFPVQ